jgi:hypothetical protein
MKAGSQMDNGKYLAEIRKRMSDAGGIIRDRKKAELSFTEAVLMLENLPEKIGAGTVTELTDSFLLLDHCLTHLIYLGAIHEYLKQGGRSRGSFIVSLNQEEESTSLKGQLNSAQICLFDRDIENKILEVGYKNGLITMNLEDVRAIPEQDLWFEKVWKDFLEDNYTES